MSPLPRFSFTVSQRSHRKVRYGEELPVLLAQRMRKPQEQVVRPLWLPPESPIGSVGPAVVGGSTPCVVRARCVVERNAAWQNAQGVPSRDCPCGKVNQLLKGLKPLEMGAVPMPGK